MTKIVSGNYRDPTSPYRWLIRDIKEPPSSARACRFVQGAGVEFIMSGRHEQGFGCTIVARCETAEAIDPEGLKEMKLRFDEDHFVDRKTGLLVPGCDILQLYSNGNIWAFNRLT